MESRNDAGNTPQRDEAERVEAKRLILHDMASREASSDHSKGYFNSSKVRVAVFHLVVTCLVVAGATGILGIWEHISVELITKLLGTTGVVAFVAVAFLVINGQFGEE